MKFLGESFQYKLAKEFMENHEFFEDLSPILDQNMFTDPNLKIYIGVMKNYFEKRGYVPSYSLMGIELRTIANSEREMETYLATMDKIANTPSEGSDRIRELALRFFRQQNIIKTANEILKIAGNGDITKYDTVVSMLSNAMEKGIHNDYGSSVFDNLEETLSEDYRAPIPTGVGKIDETLEGGLGKGELGLIIGPTSFGKAQPLDSNILTPSGYKKMGDMKVGDKVIGSDGKSHFVTGVYPQGKRPIYKVTFSNGSSCECDTYHLWQVNDGQVLTLKEMLDNGLVKDNKHQYTIPSVGVVEFENTKEVEYTFTKDTHIPTEILIGSVEARQRILEEIKNQSIVLGQDTMFEVYYFDVDTMPKARQIRFLAMSLGYMALNASIESKDGIAYRTIFFTKPGAKLPVFILDAEYIGEKEAQCIMVDSDDHLYVTEDFVVTHNTSLTTAMASHAACSGHKVVQIVFEDRVKQIQRKHIGRITGIEAKDLSKSEYIDTVMKTIQEFEGRDLLRDNLKIVKFPSGEKSVRDIEKYLHKLTNKGFKPDMIVVDYFECLAHRNEGNDEYERQGMSMRYLEKMAGELDMAIWVPTQGTRDSVAAELVTTDKVGGSFKKSQIAHVIMSIARSVDDIANNKATVAILKNRAGKSGKIFNNVDFNNGTCRISTDCVDELDSLFEHKKKRDEELVKMQADLLRQVKEKERQQKNNQ